MDRAFASGASGTPPTAPASPSIGYPTKGNAGTGTPATKPGEYWYHMITEEMRAVIAAAGLTPSQSDLTQLLQALPGALASRPEMARSLAASGYQRLPGGLIVQWGTNSIVGISGSSFSYPIAFPNACLCLSGTVDDVSDTATFATGYVTGTPKTTGSFRLNNTNTRSVCWFAIGY